MKGTIVEPRIVEYWESPAEFPNPEEVVLSQEVVEEVQEPVMITRYQASSLVYRNASERPAEQWGGRRVRRPLDVVFLNQSAGWRFVMRVAKRRRELERYCRQ